MKQLYLFFVFGCLYAAAMAQPTPPPQPTTGPGSNNPLYTGVTLYDYGTNANADGFWLFEPTGPTPDSANVVVFIHGWGETNLKYYGAMIDRIIRAGNIVICSRYQKTADAVYATYTDSCAAGVQRALDTLKYAPGHVKPRLYNYFILGHSMGGVLTANLTARYQYYNLPKPLAAFSMEPGANVSGLVLSPTVYAGFPSDVNYLIAIGHDDNVVDSTVGLMLFYQTTGVPTSHKNLVKQWADNHGSPALAATHMEPCSSISNGIYDDGESTIATILTTLVPPDAVDFYDYWKLWDALVDCSLTGTHCNVAFGNTPEQKFMGLWSDSVPVVPLTVIPDFPAGIADVPDHIHATVSPNPVSGASYQVTVSSVAGGTVFALYDINGRKVSEQNLPSPTTIIQNKLLTGMYFYQVRNTANGALSGGKLVVE